MKQQETSAIGAAVRVDTTDHSARLGSLERRLYDGYQRIDEAVLAGTDVSEWESFWLRLLREYEGVCRELDEAA